MVEQQIKALTRQKAVMEHAIEKIDKDIHDLEKQINNLKDKKEFYRKHAYEYEHKIRQLEEYKIKLERQIKH